MAIARWRRLGPLGLVGLAFLALAIFAFPPNPVIDLGLIDLAPGAIKKATFRVGYAEKYAIGVMMDQTIAAQVYPCTADPELLWQPQCRLTHRTWPVSLAIAI